MALRATASHLRPVGNAAPPRPRSFASSTSLQDGVRPHVERRAQRLVAAVRAVAVELVGVGDADAAQQPHLEGRRPAGRAGGGMRRRVAAAEHVGDPSAVTGATGSSCGISPAWSTITAGARSHTPRHGLSSQIAWPLPGCWPSGPTLALELGDEVLRAARDARDVGAHVRDDRRLGLEREQRVERRDAVRLRRRDREPLADVVERAAADPARRAPARRAAWAAAGGAALGRLAAAERDAGVAFAGLARALPPARRRAQDGVDRLALGGRRRVVVETMSI